MDDETNEMIRTMSVSLIIIVVVALAIGMFALIVGAFEKPLQEQHADAVRSGVNYTQGRAQHVQDLIQQYLDQDAKIAEAQANNQPAVAASYQRSQRVVLREIHDVAGQIPADQIAAFPQITRFLQEHP